MKNEPMTVAELKRIIRQLPDHMKVVIQEDAEGNGFHYAAGGDENCIMVEERHWTGTVYDATWDADEAGMDESEWEGTKSLPRCLVIY